MRRAASAQVRATRRQYKYLHQANTPARTQLAPSLRSDILKSTIKQQRRATAASVTAAKPVDTTVTSGETSTSVAAGKTTDKPLPKRRQTLPSPRIATTETTTKHPMAEETTDMPINVRVTTKHSPLKSETFCSRKQLQSKTESYYTSTTLPKTSTSFYDDSDDPFTKFFELSKGRSTESDYFLADENRLHDSDYFDDKPGYSNTGRVRISDENPSARRSESMTHIQKKIFVNSDANKENELNDKTHRKVS